MIEDNNSLNLLKGEKQCYATSKLVEYRRTRKQMSHISDQLINRLAGSTNVNTTNYYNIEQQCIKLLYNKEVQK